MDRQTDEKRTDGRADRQTGGKRTDGRADGQTDGRASRQTDGRASSQTESLYSFCNRQSTKSSWGRELTDRIKTVKRSERD